MNNYFVKKNNKLNNYNSLNFFMTAQILLASASPRRSELLHQLGVCFQIYAPNIDETPFIHEDPLDYVQRMAESKAIASMQVNNNTIPILTADTVVVLHQQIMGKPQDYADAIAMLTALSGHTHYVYSAICVLTDQIYQAVSISEVRFKSLTEKEIIAYCQTKEPWDKAGAYAVQGLAAMFIEHIKGSFSGIMGLPLFETAQLLRQAGVILPI